MKKDKYAEKIWAAWSKSNSLYMRWANSKGMNYYDMSMFYALHGGKSLTQKEICEFFGMPKTTVNGIMKRLKEQGFIESASDMRDGRAKIIRLTDLGERYAEEQLSDLYGLEKKITGSIDREKMKSMVETLHMYNILFEEELK